MKFNERLRQLRQETNHTQKELASKLDVSTITIRQYEQGTREPNIDKLLRLATFFDVSLDDLLCPTFRFSLSLPRSLSGDN